jgi:hypothetical protein
LYKKEKSVINLLKKEQIVDIKNLNLNLNPGHIHLLQVLVKNIIEAKANKDKVVYIFIQL